MPANGHTNYTTQPQPLQMRSSPKGCRNLMNDELISSMSRANVVFLGCSDVTSVKKTYAKLIYSAGFL